MGSPVESRRGQYCLSAQRFSSAEVDLHCDPSIAVRAANEPPAHRAPYHLASLAWPRPVHQIPVMQKVTQQEPWHEILAKHRPWSFLPHMMRFRPALSREPVFWPTRSGDSRWQDLATDSPTSI